jgi:23S rRNA pseudouridine955/2504/2580 synthase
MKQIPLVFENDYALILNKPAGLSVQGGEGVKTSLDSLLSQNYQPRPLLVHRLDKDTSGLILTAKTREAAAAFSALFAGGESRPVPAEGRGIRKQYLAVCSGSPQPAEGVIRASLDVRGKKRESQTSYRLLSAVENFSLLELELGTGRMHQIRRHLMLIGHPVLGDDKYGDFALNRSLRKQGLKRLLLHAFRLVIPPLPPFLPQGLDLRVPPPEYFAPYMQP